MSALDNRTEEYLARARALVAELEAGRVEKADSLLDELSGMRESSMFLDLGRLTRGLHQALNNFQMDTRLANLSQTGMPGTRDRLHDVVRKTEESAHRTLKAVEDSIPIARRLENKAELYRQQCEAFLHREMDMQDLRRLAQTMREFLPAIVNDAHDLSRNLSEIRLAQEYQDLTGQVILRVVQVVQEVEDELVEMLRVCGNRLQGPGGQAHRQSGGDESKPGLLRPEVVAGQDEVDRLLSGMGF